MLYVAACSRDIATKSGAWFDQLEKAQSGLPTVAVIASFYKQLHPEASRLAELIENLVKSNKWAPDLELLMTSAITALHDLAEARPLKGHIEKLEAQLKRARSVADTGAVDASVAEALETRFERARRVFEALEG
jgi:hypothetical protein